MGRLLPAGGGSVPADLRIHSGEATLDRPGRACQWTGAAQATFRSFEPSDLVPVSLVRPVGEPERPRVCPPVGEGGRLAHTAAGAGVRPRYSSIPWSCSSGFAALVSRRGARCSPIMGSAPRAR
jgi:hypothetical protein